MNAPIPENEKLRLANLLSYKILDTPSEQEYDDIALLAAQICGTPIALISLVDEDRQWFKSKIGMGIDETPREQAFCAHALSPVSPEVLVVQDALDDERFADNPLVTGDPGIRFYAGAPLISPDNYTVGTLCVIDREPRRLSPQQIEALQALARQVSLKLELRRMSQMLQTANDSLQSLSLTDDLTGLYNRRGFLFHAEQQLKLFHSRKSDRGLWVMMADMDNLKQINDSFGHLEGSAAIAETAEIIKKTFRKADIVARLGGDEFVVLLINADSEFKEKITERMEKKFAEHNAVTDKSYKISVSYGLFQVPFGSSHSIEEIIKYADDAMYVHKRSKRKSSD